MSVKENKIPVGMPWIHYPKGKSDLKYAIESTERMIASRRELANKDSERYPFSYEELIFWDSLLDVLVYQEKHAK